MKQHLFLIGLLALIGCGYSQKNPTQKISSGAGTSTVSAETHSVTLSVPNMT